MEETLLDRYLETIDIFIKKLNSEIAKYKEFIFINFSYKDIDVVVYALDGMSADCMNENSTPTQRIRLQSAIFSLNEIYSSIEKISLYDTKLSKYLYYVAKASWVSSNLLGSLITANTKKLEEESAEETKEESIKKEGQEPKKTEPLLKRLKAKILNLWKEKKWK